MLRTVQEQLPVNRQRRSYPQTFARAVVDFVCNRIQFFLAVNRQIRALGQVLPHQAIHVLV